MSYRSLKTGIHDDLFKMPETISPKPFAVGVNRWHHRLLGTREPYRQFFIKIKNGRVSTFVDLSWLNLNLPPPPPPAAAFSRGDVGTCGLLV